MLSKVYFGEASLSQQTHQTVVPQLLSHAICHKYLSSHTDRSSIWAGVLTPPAHCRELVVLRQGGQLTNSRSSTTSICPRTRPLPTSPDTSVLSAEKINPDACLIFRFATDIPLSQPSIIIVQSTNKTRKHSNTFQGDQHHDQINPEAAFQDHTTRTILTGCQHSLSL